MKLIQSDYNCIGQVAMHCNLEKLCIAQEQSTEFDLEELYCNDWIDILAIWNEIIDYRIAVEVCDADPDCDTPPTEPIDYALKVNLIEGGTYTNCNGKTATHNGVKRVLVYYSYGRYVLLNGNNDTASGLVTKTDQFAIPKTQKELEGIADQYRNMGLISFEKTIKFLCANKTTFDFFNSNTCKYKCGCGCDDNCGGTKARGYGLRSSNISK